MNKANLKIYEEKKSAFFSMKKFLLLFIVFLCVFIFKAPAFSQSTITVVGRGTTKEEALQDALRSAVEKATGVFLYSVTDVQNFKVVQDKIVTQSKGYIKDYQIVEEKSFDGLIVLTVTVTVDVESIKAILRTDLKAVTYDDVLKDYMLVTQKMTRLQKSAELLKVITSRPIEEMYSFDYVGYEITDVGLKSAKGNFFIRISLNPFFWDTYEKILQAISETGEKASACGLFKDKGIRDVSSAVHYAKLWANTYIMHQDLLNYVVDRMSVEIKLRSPITGVLLSVNLGVYKNCISPYLSRGGVDARNVNQLECEFTASGVREGTGTYTYGMNVVSLPQNDVLFVSWLWYTHTDDGTGAVDGFIFKDSITIQTPFEIQNPEIVKDFNRITISVK